MAEDFHPNYCWNNSASGVGFHRSNSTSTTNSGGAAASSDWPSTTEISQSKHTPNFLWNQTLTGKTECTRPFSRLEVGESSSINPYKEVNSTSSMLQGLVEPGSTRFERPGLDSGQVVRDYYQSQLMAFRGVSDEKQKRLWKELGDNDYNNPVWNNASAGFYPSHQPSLLRTQLSDESKFSCRKTGLDLVGDWEERGSRTAPEHKKSRIETPSAMAANITVIGKEKLRDRVTALQQLVSPFGKTDTASVLQEAIEYIKFLHDQVNVLCAPYFKTGRPIPQNQNSVNKCVKVKEEEQRAGDLRSRGLCLVPMEIIYPAESETSIATTTSEFWTPIHGRTYW